MSLESSPRATWLWPRYEQRLSQPPGERASSHPGLAAVPGDDQPGAIAVGRPTLAGLARASYIEWRYFAVLSHAFHGIVGLALVNPDGRFRRLAEGGLLVIVAGVLDRPALPTSAAAADSDPLFASDTEELCWMHLFAAEDCQFDPLNGRSNLVSLRASDHRCRLELRQASSARASLELDTSQGLKLRLTHNGTPGAELPSAADAQLDGWLGRALGAHWQVQCPSPMAWSDGELSLEPDALAGLSEGAGGDQPCYASAALLARLAAGRYAVRWQGASGYAEHSFGVRPLPLHGWDFLFVPKPETGEALVLQTYSGSQSLRYLEVCWQQDGRLRHRRFPAHRLQLSWPEQIHDRVLGVRRPVRRRIEAEADGLHLSVDNRVLHRIPLLRRQRLLVRHFFISEEIGIADWRLSDESGQVLAEVQGQPCGGELARRRWWAPRCSS